MRAMSALGACEERKEGTMLCVHIESQNALCRRELNVNHVQNMVPFEYHKARLPFGCIWLWLLIASLRRFKESINGMRTQTHTLQ